MSSLIEMPELVLTKIIEFSDFKSVLTLRQVCRDFRNFVDDLNDSKLPDSKITRIHIFIEKGIQLYFGKSDGYFDTVSYSKNPKNLRRFNGKRKILLGNNSNILNVAFRDLELISRFQKSPLSWLQFHYIPSGFHPINFSMKNQKIKTEVLEISATSQPDFLSILQLVDPESFRFFSRNQSIIKMDQIAKTEQWKRAKSVTCGNFLKLDLKDIAHFSQSSIFHQSVSIEDLNLLKEVFIKSSKFKNCHITVKLWNEELHLGLFQVEGIYQKWYFRVKNSDEKILEIKISTKEKTIDFEIIELKNVPDQEILQD